MKVRKTICLAVLGALIASTAQAEIGRIKSTSGTATVIRGPTLVPAAIGQDLMPGDWLETGKDGRISLTFIDDTRFSVGPDSRIALTKFDYDRTTEKGSFIAKVERGSIAVVSGRIAKTRCGGQETAAQSSCGGMEVQTPKSTLAVRGTRFIITVPR
jgi:hypothetical protein